ncbi:MAG: 6-bladed beta-propeller [Phycisphaerales bacterium]|nr:MAG: 6-bladed beta-propeller [Phycisphaerales bacterium]
MRSTPYLLAVAMVLSTLLCHGCACSPTERADSGGIHCVVDVTWPQKPDHFTWAQMPGITIDAQDQVHIFTRSQPAVQVYRTDGRFVRAWDMEDFAGAHFIRIDPAGNVWTANIESHTVRKYSSEGELLLTLGEPGHAGADQRRFDRPTDMAVLPSGDIFVSDGYGNRRIVHFDANGRYVDEWGTEGDGPGQFALPHSIVADSQGRLYVADRENARIQVFDSSGKLLAVWADLMTPWGLWITKDRELWVCGSSRVRKEGADEWLVTPPADQLLMKLNLKGEVLLRVPLPKTTVPPGKLGELDWVHGIALDTKGNLYLGDIQGSRAQKFLLQP